MTRLYDKDARTFTTMNVFGRTLYHAYNCLSPEDIEGLKEEIDDELKSNPDNRDGLLETTNGLYYRKLKNKKCWVNFFSMVKSHMRKYAKLTNDPSVLQLKVASYWAKRLVDCTQEEYESEMYINYGNLHSHQNLNLGIIYYLENPSRIYGTLIEDSGREYIVPGDENSMIIHHPNVNHAAVLPPPSLTRDYPRTVIVVDFKHYDLIKFDE